MGGILSYFLLTFLMFYFSLSFLNLCGEGKQYYCYRWHSVQSMIPMYWRNLLIFWLLEPPGRLDPEGKRKAGYQGSIFLIMPCFYLNLLPFWSFFSVPFIPSKVLCFLLLFYLPTNEMVPENIWFSCLCKIALRPTWKRRFL